MVVHARQACAHVLAAIMVRHGLYIAKYVTFFAACSHHFHIVTVTALTRSTEYYFPRCGRIADIPVVNYTLMVLTLIIVLAFRTSERLSLAYGAPFPHYCALAADPEPVHANPT